MYSIQNLVSHIRKQKKEEGFPTITRTIIINTITTTKGRKKNDNLEHGIVKNVARFLFVIYIKKGKPGETM